MEEQCERIEELEKYSKTEEMYKVVKNLTKKKPTVINKQGMKKKNGVITSDVEENKTVWVEYIKELYDTEANEEMNDVDNENECEHDTIGTKIEIWEVKKAIKELKNNKALGSNGIPAEALKTLVISAISRITELINKIYDTGIWAEDLLLEKYLEKEKSLTMVFIDLEKAYDRVPHEEIWRCLREKGTPEKYVRIVRDMYERATTKIGSSVGLTERIPVQVGLHQGSALSPYLFDLIMDVLTENIRRPAPWCMMFADDVVLCGSNPE
ncbi:uncharacterized protein LOC103514534 [Diaphorina citri]|uniref:Uncharacterized protein LOC103514534 n=1 Tax=Diaphorina citri TaxID=121845 RepID=A0A1S3DA46_DIACI|nr:uncharacterized protein LOC103514534 [Diaphorina citri]